MARTLIKTCKKKLPPRLGGEHFLGGLKGGGFRVLACADTGARTTLGVHQYFLLVLYLYCTYTFNTIIVRTSSYYYQISFKRLNMYLIGLDFYFFSFDLKSFVQVNFRDIQNCFAIVPSSQK